MYLYFNSHMYIYVNMKTDQQFTTVQVKTYILKRTTALYVFFLKFFIYQLVYSTVPNYNYKSAGQLCYITKGPHCFKMISQQAQSTTYFKPPQKYKKIIITSSSTILFKIVVNNVTQKHSVPALSICMYYFILCQ